LVSDIVKAVGVALDRPIEMKLIMVPTWRELFVVEPELQNRRGDTF
jgi:hypothetical protein